MAGRDTQIVGQVIAGYKILELAGKGAMGAVYRATQLSLDRQVAFKILAPHLAENEEFVSRFKRGARSIAKINHPNILQIHDVGEEGAINFIAMELVEGHDLSDSLKDRGFLEWRICSKFIMQAAAGLAAAAGQNVIHRDIKPDNLMVTKTEHSGEEMIKVTDFGLAKVQGSEELTQTGNVIGTPAYMSPEQCDGTDLDTRTDIYSLGATFYRAATGTLPFSAPTPMAIMYKHKHEDLVPPRKYMPAIPPEMEAIIIKMMAKEREKRYSSMAEVVTAIREVLDTVPDTSESEQTMRFSDSSGVMDLDKMQPRKQSAPAAAFDFDSVPDAANVQSPQNSEELFNELVEQGNKLARENRPVAACDCWRRALELRPDDEALQRRIQNSKKESTVACLSIGANLLERGRLNASIAELRQKIAADPDDIDSREKLVALEYMEQQKRDTIMEIRKLLNAREHEKALEKWEKLHPGLRDKALAPTMENLKERVIPAKRLAEKARKLTKVGKLEEALAVWDEAVQLDLSNDQLKLGRQDAMRKIEKFEAAMNEGYEFHVQRKFRAAITCFERVLTLAPGNARTIKYIVSALTELSNIAEKKHDFDEAFDALTQLLEYTPEDEEVRARLQSMASKRAKLHDAIEMAKRLLGRGKYAKAAKAWRQALRLQPGNKVARFGLKEARRQHLFKRVIPLGLALLAVVVGGGVFLMLRFDGAMTLAEKHLETASRRRISEEYDKAVLEWGRARRVPVFGGFAADEILLKIERARLDKALLEERLLYDVGDLDALEEYRAPFELSLNESEAVFGKEVVATGRFAIEWHLGILYAKAGNYEQARDFFTKAMRIESEYGDQPRPKSEDDIMRALGKYYVAEALYEDGQKDPARRDDKKVVAMLSDAIEMWPDFTLARERRDAIENMRDRLGKRISTAHDLLRLAKNQSVNGMTKAAESNFALARDNALWILRENPDHWEAKKIRAEVEWRLYAARTGKVFFIHQPSSDPDLKSRFDAFAIDIYEWPNKKGEKPLTVNFTNAVELASREQDGLEDGDIGVFAGVTSAKGLPTRNEWLYAAGGGESRRAFSYGDQYDVAAGNTSSPQVSPRPVGSDEKARSPEGLYDMNGNVAEWVVLPNRPLDFQMQYAAGGDFKSGKKSSNTDFVERTAEINDGRTGFRSVRRWTLNRH